MRRLARLMVPALILAAATSSAAGAQDGSYEICEINPRTGFETCRIVTRLIGPDAGNLIIELSAGGSSLFRWERTSLGSNGPTGVGTGPGNSGGGVGFYCPGSVTTVTLANGDVEVTESYGIQYYVELVRIDTGDVFDFGFECVFPGETPPTPPPPPPSLEEFAERAEPLLTVPPELNPRAAFGGITGLDTWLWCTTPSDVPVSVNLRGWTAQASMSAVRAYWRIEGPSAASFDREVCGSEADPAATWQPQTLGDHIINLETTWAGFWTLTYDGIVLGPAAPLGPVDFDAAPVAYPVDEVVGVLTAGVDQ